VLSETAALSKLVQYGADLIKKNPRRQSTIFFETLAVLCPQTLNLKSQISNLKPQTSDLLFLKFHYSCPGPITSSFNSKRLLQLKMRIAKRPARRVIKHSNKDGGHTGTSIVSSASSEASDTDSKNSSKKSSKNAPFMTTRRSRSSRRSSIPRHTKHYVEHNYHDHFHDPPETTNLPASIDSNDIGLKKRRGHRGGVAVPFPEKLHYMLSRMDQEGTADIVTWQSHGRCFIVHKPKEFVEQIMPRYARSACDELCRMKDSPYSQYFSPRSFFRQSKLTSFQRQLNLYGFSRLTAGTDRGG
jgi:hypothetical protein